MTRRNNMLSCTVLRQTLLALTLSVLPPGIARAETIEAPLTYRPVAVDLRLDGTLGIRWTYMPATVASNLAGVKLPADVSPRATIVTATYCSKAYHFMADTDSTNAPFYNRAIFDANRNKDFSDDPPLAATMRLRKNGYHFMRAPVSLNLGTAGQEVWDFVLEVGGWGFSSPSWTNWPTPAAGLCFASGLFGEARIGESTYEIQMQDANGNGVYGDVSLEDFSPNRDAFAITRRSGPATNVVRKYVSRELPSILVAGDRTFRLKVDPAGRSFSLKELERGAVLQLPQKTFCGHIKSRKDLVLFMDPTTSVHLPEGEYSLRRIFLQKTDAAGFPWTLQTELLGRSDALLLAPGKPATLDFPEPFTLSASADVKKEGEYRICIGILDAAGNKLDGDLTVPGLLRPPPPATQLLGMDGSVERSIKMRYG